MIVEVTQEDIKLGTPLSGTECPIALAIRRKGFKSWDVSVAPGWIEISNPKSKHMGRYYSDQDLLMWIRSFDQLNRLDPRAKASRPKPITVKLSRTSKELRASIIKHRIKPLDTPTPAA